MFKNLNAGAIGIRNKSLAETIVLAKESGFEGIDFDIKEAAQLADAHGVAYVRDLFAANGILPGLWGLPVAWNQDQLARRPGTAAEPGGAGGRAGLHAHGHLVPFLVGQPPV